MPLTKEIIAPYAAAVTELVRATRALREAQAKYFVAPSKGGAIELYEAFERVERASIAVRKFEGPVQVALCEVESDA